MTSNSLPCDDAAADGKPTPLADGAGSKKPPTSKPEVPPSTVPNDPFDPSNLERMKLSQDFAGMTSVKPVMTTVAVRKPKKHEFVRVRQGIEWRFETSCFVDKDTGETYLVTPELRQVMYEDITPTALVLAVCRNSPVPFLWPLTLPSSDGRPNRWHESGIDAARLAESQWIRSVADMSAGCYVPHVAAAELPEPEWPVDLEMSNYLRLAFRGRLIDSIDHPCLQRLRGEI